MANWYKTLKMNISTNQSHTGNQLSTCWILGKHTMFATVENTLFYEKIKYAYHLQYIMG